MAESSEIVPERGGARVPDAPARGVVPGWWRGPCPVLTVAVWFGLAAGLVELALLVARVELFDHGAFLRSRQFLWMVPASDLLLFTATGLVLALTGGAWRRWGPAIAVGTFVALGCLGWLLLVRGLHSLACALIASGVARQSAPGVAARWPGFVALVRRTLPGLAGVLTVLVVAGVAWDWRVDRWIAARSIPAAPAGAPNVLLIVLDTVRADRLSLYGYPRDTTPELARIARRGVRFDQARSAAPWTLPSHASLFTARWPHELQVERHGRLTGVYPTLAEHLRGRGYATVGVVANTFFCGRDSGLARGFDDYRDFPVTPGAVLRSSSVGWLVARTADRARAALAARVAPGDASAVSLDFQRKDAAAVNREFLTWLSHHRGRPFFAFLNYFDAHDPYLPPPGTRTHFGKAPRSRADVVLLRDWQQADHAAVGAGAVALASDAYDDCIAALDRSLGRLFDELDRRGVLERTIVIVTADHGEQFGEHGKFRHGMSVYDCEIRVPLVVLAPSRLPAGQVVHTPVTLRGVPATVLDLLDRRAGSPFPGTSLTATLTDRPAAEPPLSELGRLVEPTRAPAASAGTSEALSAVVGEGKVYIRHERGQEELYDYKADPAETRDLSGADTSRAIVARLRATLGRLVDRAPRVKTAVVPRP